ncbi:MAG TPA: histidine kinase [Gemmatimonadaceae bacterium]|nr:histidine kinase [Gemmatimonadaceae bacterium]
MAQLPDLRAVASSRPALFRLAAVVWLTFGLAQVVQSYVLARAVGRAWSLGGALVMGMPWWLLWLAVTPAIAYAATRFPFSDGRAMRSLAAHVAASAVVACIVILSDAALFWFTTGRNLGIASSLSNQIQRFFGSYFLESVLTYGATAGAIVAIDFARAARDETVARMKAEAEATALEASVTEARLEALAMELNPHFLFNTLGAIAALVSQDRPREARAVIERLSGLLRRTLGSRKRRALDADASVTNGALGGQFNSIASELEILDDYLYIQRVRFSDRLRVTVDVDDQARQCAIPTMLLQPLVENAIRHGIEDHEGVGDVRVQVDRIAGSVRIAIGDSGSGFPLDAAGQLEHEGIGISNTRSRLAHLFGAQATLVLRNREGGGAEAIVVLPALDVGVPPAPVRVGDTWSGAFEETHV